MERRNSFIDLPNLKTQYHPQSLTLLLLIPKFKFLCDPYVTQPYMATKKFRKVCV